MNCSVPAQREISWSCVGGAGRICNWIAALWRRRQSASYCSVSSTPAQHQGSVQHESGDSETGVSPPARPHRPTSAKQAHLSHIVLLLWCLETAMSLQIVWRCNVFNAMLGMPSVRRADPSIFNRYGRFCPSFTCYFRWMQWISESSIRLLWGWNRGVAPWYACPHSIWQRLAPDRLVARTAQRHARRSIHSSA